MKLFLGAPGIVCPLGKSLDEVHQKVFAGNSGLRKVSNAFSSGVDAMLGLTGEVSLQAMVEASIDATLSGVVKTLVHSEATLLVYCTTKGEISRLEEGDVEGAKLYHITHAIQRKYGLAHEPVIVSMACISGLSGLIHAARLIERGFYKHIILLGADRCSAFTLTGFQSFMALSEEECRPFDRNRKGINLGEAAVSLVMSCDRGIFKEAPLGEYLAGALANDANHISGPSRDGEGLFRAIEKVRANSPSLFSRIQHIQAHGTATQYNDDMESHAFRRAGLHDVPVNSLKAYFGHTLGAAGLLESMITLKAMERGQIPASRGFTEHGTAFELAVIKEPLTADVSLSLKTASGFGGSNAAVLLGRYDD